MVQIIQEAPKKKSFLQNLGQGFANASQLGTQLVPEELMARKQEKALSALLGENLEGIRDQNIQKQIVGDIFKRQEAQRKEEAERLNMPDYETVQELFGDKFAKLYDAATTGGKSELLKTGLGALERGQNIRELFGENIDISSPSSNVDISVDEFGPVFEEMTTDFTKKPKGYSAKEWSDERKTWRKDNNKIFETINEQLKGNRRDVLGTEKLIKLNNSGKLPEGLERAIINPKTGEPYKLLQLAEVASPEAQEWVKEIARFGNRAKDAFGSRVTNFDLMQYMKQFPSLLNSPEGRARILKMMEINYKLDSLFNNALKKVYQTKKLNGIAPEDAQRIAENMVKDESESLYTQYLNLESQNEQQFVNTVGSSKPSLQELWEQSQR